jgi:hypothetical protein
MGWSFVAWRLLVSSFLIEIIRDVGLSSRILGYGDSVIERVLVFVELGIVLLQWLIRTF